MTRRAILALPAALVAAPLVGRPSYQTLEVPAIGLIGPEFTRVWLTETPIGIILNTMSRAAAQLKADHAHIFRRPVVYLRRDDIRQVVRMVIEEAGPDTGIATW